MESDSNTAKSWRYGNFKVERGVDGTHETLVVGDINGRQKIVLRDDCSVFHVMMMMLGDKEYDDYMTAWVSYLYMSISVVPDLGYLDGFHDIYKALVSRVHGAGGDSPDAEEWMDEEKLEVDMREEIERIDSEAEQ